MNMSDHSVLPLAPTPPTRPRRRFRGSRLRPPRLARAALGIGLVAGLVTGALAVPDPALAAPARCALLMPTKIVVNSATEQASVRLASSCTAAQVERAVWSLRQPGGGLAMPIAFEPADLAAGRTAGSVEFYDDDRKGAWTARPHEVTGPASADLVQNTPVTLLKYGSRIAASVDRSRNGLTWTVKATQWSGAAHAWVKRPKVRVGLFHRASGSSGWRYVTSVRTSSAGTARVSLRSLKAGSYRLVIAETPTVWAAYSRTVRGKI
jgi:hypothetical protein